ncbi:MAG: polysulfide reductase NrfD, partial [Amylibacter sp.]
MTDIILNVQEGDVWGWKVALDLFLGGAGVGALLFAVGVDQVFKGRYRWICQTAAWISPVLVAVGLLFLFMKMGRPLNMWQVYVNFNPLSPIWWGGIFQPLLLIGSVVYAYLWLHNDDLKKSIRRKLGW